MPCGFGAVILCLIAIFLPTCGKTWTVEGSLFGWHQSRSFANTPYVHLSRWDVLYTYLSIAGYAYKVNGWVQLLKRYCSVWYSDAYKSWKKRFDQEYTNQRSQDSHKYGFRTLQYYENGSDCTCQSSYSLLKARSYTMAFSYANQVGTPAQVCVSWARLRILQYVR